MRLASGSDDGTARIWQMGAGFGAGGGSGGALQRSVMTLDGRANVLSVQASVTGGGGPV